MDDFNDGYDGDDERNEEDEQHQLDLEYYGSFTKREIIDFLTLQAEDLRRGEMLTLEEIFGPGWKYLPLNLRRQASKEFKILVCTKRITSVYFLTGKKRNQSFIYGRK